MPVSDFRRSVMQDTKKKTGGGGNRGSWHDNFRLPKDLVSALAVIYAEYIDPNPPDELVRRDSAGNVLPVKNIYYKFKKHRLKTFRNGKDFILDDICSAGPNPHNPQPCLSCYHQESGDKRITTSNAFAIGIVHLANYHMHPLWDARDKKFAMKREPGAGPVLIQSECTARTGKCNFCNLMQGRPPQLEQGEFFPQYDPKFITIKFGARRYLELGPNHLANIGDWDKQIGDSCNGVVYDPETRLPVALCRNQLTVASYNCPDCRGMIIDVTTDPRSLEEIEDVARQPHPCATCRKQVIPVDVLECDNTIPDPAFPGKPLCSGMVRQTLYDTALMASRQGDGTNSRLTLTDYKSLEAFGKTVHPALLGGKTFKEVMAELAQPYKFEDVIKPRDIEGQAKRMELTIPSSMGGQPAYSGPTYGNYPQQNNAPAGGFMGAPGAAPNYNPPPVPPQQQYGNYGGGNVGGASPNQGPGPGPYTPPGRPNFGQ